MDPSVKPENANETAMNRNATETTAAGSSQDVSALVSPIPTGFIDTLVFP